MTAGSFIPHADNNPASQTLIRNEGIQYLMDTFTNRNPFALVILMVASLLLAGIPAVLAADGTNAPSSVGGTIIVRSFPSGAAVYLNDDYIGNATIVKRAGIPPGKYLVRVSMAGYIDDMAPIELFDGSTREIGFNLEPASSATAAPTGSGSIAVDSSPSGAVVILDGKTVGTTRMDGYAFIMENVPAGNHTISVELSGYPPFTSTVMVLKNQVVKVTANLVTGTPTISDTMVATTDRTKPAPLSPLTAIAAAGLIGLAAVIRRS